MAISGKVIEDRIGSLIAWLETWKTSDGAYNGFIIHRFEQKRMRNIHDTAWTQAAIIRGYCNLLKKYGETTWKNKLTEAADLQRERYDAKTGKYRYAGHEDDRYCSLVHCALANCALLEAGELIDEKRKVTYLEAVKGNIDLYWLKSLWVEEENAFRFSDVDFMSLNEDRFVINFNTTAAECLIKLFKVTGEERYKNIAMKVGEWLLQKCERAREYFDKQDIGKTGRGLPYQYTRTQVLPDNYVSLYAGLSLRGIAELYQLTKDIRYGELLIEIKASLFRMIDPVTNLFSHTVMKGKIIPYPQFVAGAGMCLAGIAVADNAMSIPHSNGNVLSAVLDKQYNNGSYPSFIGKNYGRKHGDVSLVWEDVAAGVNWNAQLFEYLTMLVDGSGTVKIPKSQPVNVIIKKRFIYCDMSKKVLIVSWGPLLSIGFYFINKVSKTAVSINPRNILNVFRNINGNGKKSIPNK